MIGVAIITYNRPDNFYKILESIKNVDHIVLVKDGGTPKYTKIPNYDFYQLTENKGVGFCKNWAIEKLLEKGCDHLWILEDDCLVTDNRVWQYCIEFSKESGLLHFNWNDYRQPRFAKASFPKFEAYLNYHTEANFSYFHKDFLKDIRFDTKYINAWEHVDLELQGEKLGFLPAFRIFVSPANLEKYLKLVDDGESTISGKAQYEERVVAGHHYLKDKWGKAINEFDPPNLDEFYEKMKEITLKYAKRT
jgi:glycosyltransferase involved in cell wall biosynthesis